MKSRFKYADLRLESFILFFESVLCIKYLFNNFSAKMIFGNFLVDSIGQDKTIFPKNV